MACSGRMVCNSLLDVRSSLSLALTPISFHEAVKRVGSGQ